MYFATVFAQFVQKRRNIFFRYPFHLQFSAAGGDGDEEGARFDPVFDGGIFDAVKFFHPFDGHGAAARPFTLRPCG